MESQVPPDRGEPPATLPITEGSRASSHSSIEALPPSTLITHQHRASSPPEDIEVCIHVAVYLNIALLSLFDCLVQLAVPQMERAQSPPGQPGTTTMFQGVLDQEKRVLVEKICSLKRDMARCEERVEFFESHAQQLTEDIQKKSKLDAIHT